MIGRGSYSTSMRSAASFASMIEFGDHHRHGLADMAHAVARQARPRRAEHRRAVAPLGGGQAAHVAEPVGGIILPGQDREHARHLQRGARVDAADLGVRMGRAQEDRIGLIVEGDVVRVAPPALQEPWSFDLADRLADGKSRHRVPTL